MKKIILGFMLLTLPLLLNAQSFTFKTVEKQFIDEVGFQRVVVGIRAKIYGMIDCNLSDSTFSRTFNIEFVLSSGLVYGRRTARTDEFVAKMVSIGMTELNAKKAIELICKNLEYGTKEEKYQAAQQLSASYGYTLKPITEQ